MKFDQSPPLREIFIEAVVEIAEHIAFVGGQGQEFSRRHFRFSEDKYFIEARTRLSFDGAIYKVFHRRVEEIETLFPALHTCLQSLAPFYKLAKRDLDDGMSLDFGYWQAHFHVRSWVGQCFSMAKSAGPGRSLCGEVFDDRFELLSSQADSRTGAFIVPVHGLSWGAEVERFAVSPSISICKFNDDLKSEGWYDYWFDFCSTIPKDIARCEVAIVSSSRSTAEEIDTFLACLRLCGFRGVKAPDRFSPTHEYSPIASGPGPIDGFGPLWRPAWHLQEIKITDLEVTRAIFEKVVSIKDSRNYGPLDTPVRRYVLACNRRDTFDSLMDLALSIETLVGQGESQFRALALLAHHVGAEEVVLVRSVLDGIKRARNQIAHTGRCDDQYSNNNFLSSAYALVADLLCATIEQLDSDRTALKSVLSSRIDRLLAEGLEGSRRQVNAKWWRAVI